MHVFYTFPHSCFPSCCAPSRVESSEEARFSRPFECDIAQHLYLIFERKHAESLPPLQNPFLASTLRNPTHLVSASINTLTKNRVLSSPPYLISNQYTSNRSIQTRSGPPFHQPHIQ